MKRRHVALLLMMLSVSMLVSTAAAPIRPGWEDQLSDDIVLHPTDGPNGRYAVQNSNGELELVFGSETSGGEWEGLNVYGAFEFDRVFSIRNTGDDERAVWLTDDTDRLQYYRGTRDSDSLEGRANRTVLEPGERVDVGLYIKTLDVDIRRSFRVYVATVGGSEDPGQTAVLGGSDSGTLQIEGGSEGSDGSDVSSPTATQTDAPAGTLSPTDTPTRTPSPTATQTDAPAGTPSPADATLQVLAGGLSFVGLLVLAVVMGLVGAVAVARYRNHL